MSMNSVTIDTVCEPIQFRRSCPEVASAKV
jgi:hypothetical protein